MLVVSVCKKCNSEFEENDVKECPVCHKLRDKTYRDKHRQEFKYRLGLLLKKARRRAKKKGLPFDINNAYMLDILKAQDYKCFYSGLPLNTSGPQEKLMSIDRLSSARGYERGNVCLALVCLNAGKSRLDVGEFIEMCKRVAEREGVIKACMNARSAICNLGQ